MSKRFENLESALCKELERLDKKYSADMELTTDDAEKADLLYHALKSAETYHAMADAQEDEEGEYSGEGAGRSYRGSSYARGRNSRNGRFMSRGMGSGGYSGRYDDGYSGYYPMMDGMGPYWGGR